MERAVHVGMLLLGRKPERRRRRFQLVERAERRLARRGRTVVVAVDDVPLERLALDFPHRVDVGVGIRGTRELDQRKDAPLPVVAAGHRARARG